MASAIQSGYSDLFHTYSDACRRSDQELRDFFSTKTSAGAKVVGLTVTTFKNLCTLADFTGMSRPGSDGSNPPAPAVVEQGSISVAAASSRIGSAEEANRLFARAETS